VDLRTPRSLLLHNLQLHETAETRARAQLWVYILQPWMRSGIRSAAESERKRAFDKVNR